MNRLKQFLGQSPEPERPDDYYEIEWKYERFPVTKDTALEVVRCLAENPLPQWITFRDLTGAQHRIRASKISRISESTVAQRAAEREFSRARREEDRRDRRPWEDDEL
jgi:hypothetical protein